MQVSRCGTIHGYQEMRESDDGRTRKVRAEENKDGQMGHTWMRAMCEKVAVDDGWANVR
jgi:hypothetical protein